MSEKRKKDEEKEMESKSEKSIKCSERVDSARVSHESSKDSIRYVKSDPLYKLNPDPLINESSITKLKSLEIPDTIYEVEDKRCKERSPGTSTREMESESSVVVDLCKQNSQVMKEKLKKPNRCAVCRKRVGLTGIVCRCGDTFCSAHRYTDTHNCPIDYRELGAEEIRKKNPLIKKDKVNKI